MGISASSGTQIRGDKIVTKLFGKNLHFEVADDCFRYVMQLVDSNNGLSHGGWLSS